MTWAQVDRTQLLELSAQDPWVRWATSSELLAVAGEDGWACVGPWRPSGHWGGTAVVAPGSPERAESEALAVLAALADEQGVSVEWFSTLPGRSLEVPGGLAPSGSGHWDFLWTRETPVLDRVVEGVELVELDDVEDAERIADFGLRHNLSFEGYPGRGYATLWLGVVDDGDLVGVGAVHELASGIPHLAGIVVAQEQRGRGIGALLTARLTTAAIEEAGVSTLGVYSDNTAALRLYDALGYRTAHRLHTRSLRRSRS
ncbi:GNAT family N-acetyltransferase [Ornithinimicrobium humiphilum]|uniref:GNAT family N-acetyltransferase n=1 Tax=Ornithinimicrobium humiphilum TaxID=125288 RepID=UPI001150D07F|nr:GNAT family N-acetyltransferase [Ornithinimicrobium humiphilum]